jgi:hypothetical protein
MELHIFEKEDRMVLMVDRSLYPSHKCFLCLVRVEFMWLLVQRGARKRGHYGLTALVVILLVATVYLRPPFMSTRRGELAGSLLISQNYSDGHKGADTGLKCKVYYLNMDKSVARRLKFEESFKPFWGEKLERVPAVDGRDKEVVSESQAIKECGAITSPAPTDAACRC